MHRARAGVLGIQVAAVATSRARRVVGGGVTTCHRFGVAQLAGVAVELGVRIDRTTPRSFVVRQIAAFIPLSKCRRPHCGCTCGRLQGAGRSGRCTRRVDHDQPSCQSRYRRRDDGPWYLGANFAAGVVPRYDTGHGRSDRGAQYTRGLTQRASRCSAPVGPAPPAFEAHAAGAPGLCSSAVLAGPDAPSPAVPARGRRVGLTAQNGTLPGADREADPSHARRHSVSPGTAAHTVRAGWASNCPPAVASRGDFTRSVGTVGPVLAFRPVAGCPTITRRSRAPPTASTSLRARPRAAGNVSATASHPAARSQPPTRSSGQCTPR